MNTTKKVSLLIVDDDPPIRRLLERVAVRAGFDVDTARDGVEALEKMEKRQYAIAIIDLMMPRLSGYDLVQKISLLDPRPVIIVATALTNGDVAKIDDTLVRRVIRKPFDVKSVADALVDTARHIAEKQAGLETPVPIASPDAALIKVIDDETKADEEKSDERKPPSDELPKRTPT
ncbi:MAG TPA: response regulator [Thermoanaerobaculia bacterium]|nr:response regulator [Thermoanaerobaculia bacterium]